MFAWLDVMLDVLEPGCSRADILSHVALCGVSKFLVDENSLSRSDCVFCFSAVTLVAAQSRHATWDRP